jgi:hypothetical protein
VQFHPSMTYSPNGTLGLMWQSWPGSVNTYRYDVWATSNDGGTTLSQPLEVSDGDSPAPYSNFFLPFTDPSSFITFDGQDAVVAWADMLDRCPASFVSVIKLQAFDHS